MTGLLCTLAPQGGVVAAVGAAVGVTAGVVVPEGEVGGIEVGGVEAAVTGVFGSFIFCTVRIWLLLK